MAAAAKPGSSSRPTVPSVGRGRWWGYSPVVRVGNDEVKGSSTEPSGVLSSKNSSAATSLAATR